MSNDFDPTMIARWYLLPKINSRIAATEAQHRAAEIYFAAVDHLFSNPDLPACEHDRIPRPGIEAAGTYVCVFHPDRLRCLLCSHGPLDRPRHQDLVGLLRLWTGQRGSGVNQPDDRRSQLSAHAHWLQDLPGLRWQTHGQLAAGVV